MFAKKDIKTKRNDVPSVDLSMWIFMITGMLTIANRKEPITPK
jgi:hypothetical protein